MKDSNSLTSNKISEINSNRLWLIFNPKASWSTCVQTAAFVLYCNVIVHVTLNVFMQLQFCTNSMKCFTNDIHTILRFYPPMLRMCQVSGLPNYPL